MDIGAVVEQLDAYTSGEFGGQALVLELATGDGLCGLSDEQRQLVLHLADLAADVGSLCLYTIVGSLGALHAGRAGASQVHLQLHHVPRILGEASHTVDNLHLPVKHEQRVIEIGNATDDVGLYHRLVVLCGQQLHLGAALLVEQVAEEVDIPASRDGQRVRLGGGSTVERGDGALRCERQRGDEGQFGHLQGLVHHFHIECGIEQVGVVGQSALDEALQLRVGEDAAPRHVAETGGIFHGQGVGKRHGVAHQSLGVHLGALIFVVESATAQQSSCKDHDYDFFHTYSSTLYSTGRCAYWASSAATSWFSSSSNFMGRNFSCKLWKMTNSPGTTST